MTATAAPSVALLVPARNAARFLPQLAAAALVQTQPFTEWWLFDDGSTDDTATVAEQLGFRVLRSPVNVGPAAARNALAEATGCTWVHFHDADDLLSPEYVTATLAAGEAGADLVICDMPWIDGATQTLIHHWTYDEAELRQAPFAALIRQTIGGINALYRRSRFLAVGGFAAQRRYWEDLDLSLRLFEARVPFALIPRDLVTAVRHPTSYSNSTPAAVWMAKIDVMAEWLPRHRDELGATVAREAEGIAIRMLDERQIDAARRAIALCLAAGGRPPTSHNRLVRSLRPLLPPFALLRMQQALRRRVAASRA